MVPPRVHWGAALIQKSAWHSVATHHSCHRVQQLAHKWVAVMSAQEWEKHIIQHLILTGLEVMDLWHFNLKRQWP